MTSEKKGLIQRIAESYVRISSGSPWMTLGVLLLLTLGMGFFAAQIRIRTDLRLLLPSDASSVKALGLSEKRMGSTDFFTIAFEDSSMEKVGRFQRALADSLERWKEAQWVQYDEDQKFFQRHALIYLPADQLTDLEARLKAMAKESKSKNVMDMDLLSDDEGPEARADMEGWPDRMAIYKQGIPMDIVEGLLGELDKANAPKSDTNSSRSDSGALAEMAVPAAPPAPVLPDSLQDRMIGYHAERGKWVGVVMAQLRIPSTEAQFATEAKEYGERTSKKVQDALGITINSSVVGAYRDPSTEIEEINADMWVSSVVAITLILGLLIFYMRRPANVLVVFVPLLVSMVWMMGAADIVYGRLTVLTSFVLALLSGLGIEYGIHIYSRWMEERRNGLNAEEAMGVSLSRTGRSLISAMAASITCMLALQVGHFQGFKEFGIVVSLGIFFAFLSALSVLPPLLFGMLRIGRMAERKQMKILGWLAPSDTHLEGAVLVPSLSWSRKTMTITFAIAALATVFFAANPGVAFEDDFANLRGGKGRFEWLSGKIKELTKDPQAEAKQQQRISYGRAVGKGKNTTPSVVLAQSEEQMREIHDTLGARFGTPADSMLKSFVTIQSFVPRPEVQAQRKEILERIKVILDTEKFTALDAEQKAKLKLLRVFADCDTFGFDSLPTYARRFMTETDGSHGKFGFIYADMRESNAVESRKFQLRNGEFTTSTGTAPVASSGFIYADVVQMVKDDVNRLAVAVFLFLSVIVFLDTRSWRGLVLNMGYVSLIAVWTIGAMGWFGLKLGMFNIVVIPALLSNTVDSTIHLYHRRMELGAGKISEIYHTSGSSVLAGTLTNAFGFLALIVVAHQGLNTIGMLAVLGYAAGIMIMFLAMPFLLEVVCPKAPQVGHGGD
jgi:predicted RND superfamily exporter protein